jgi:putative ABC transport system permease protein
MTRAFRLNLTALSLLALVCGMFLIYNTMTFAVVQRRTLFGTLRALGVTRREILATVAAEAVAVGILGTLLGLGAGVLLGNGLVRLVTRTINDLYFVLSVRELALDPLAFATGAALGLGATLGAALRPAFEATTAPPRTALSRAALETRARHGVSRSALSGSLLGLAGGAVLALSDGLLPAFGGLFAVILGCALLVPAATVGLMALARRPAEALLGVLGKMAARGVVAALSRTGVAVAALAIAVSVAVGVGVMISSFRGTLVDWLDLTLRADVYVRPPGPDRRPGSRPLDPVALRAIRETPGVAGVDLLRRTEVRVVDVAGDRTSEERRRAAVQPPASLLAFRLGDRGRSSFRMKEGRPERAWDALASSDAVLVSEPFATLRGVGPGDRIALLTPRGPHDFNVAGVYFDYASDQGAVLMDLATYRRLWQDRSVSGVSVYAAQGVDADDLAATLRRRTAPTQALLVRSNRALRELSLEIFDRTFVVTDVLRLLAGLVAFIGVLSALMALELERSRELGVLRANGLTPGQVWKLVTSETGLMGLAAGLLSIPVGLVLAAIMIYVINRRSFGWTLVMELPPGVLLEALALALGAALLAGLYPAWRMSRVSPAAALREE